MKLWANLKQGQREALIIERQARLATGGGPQVHETTVDPDIANITPHLMKTAPCLFSSNMSEACLNSKYINSPDSKESSKRIHLYVTTYEFIFRYEKNSFYKKNSMWEHII